ncbi:hypothetical protein Q8A67_016849 [Cirrhinus molitorella]|uniref:Uncharacterized protein n=1 Tax=Cirrhinus molitorella TaxID=172907 RepID=A0AA88TL69_9TELE|nr:hypothetical protein Q8A67_016836 [Cirrhinus molitorella]KAK2886008.1 hypothetical protein Q8A67_016845 [Cirrhinus molitorella]KAK2886012.1 hypothetical protein Q8A67_016849 [Cirrhinus molitorella]
MQPKAGEGVKPLRGKRVGSARSARRTQPGRGLPVGRAVPLERGPAARSPATRSRSGALLPRRCSATGSGSAGKGPGAKVVRDASHGRGLYRALPPRLSRLPPGPRFSVLAPSPPPSLGRVGGTGPPAPGVRSPGAYCPQYAPVGAAPPGRGPGPRQGRPRSAERSATHPTRLETRTKESNARASQRVSSSPHGAMKVKAFPLPGGRSPRWDPPAPAGGAPPARLVPRERGRWSESACESTRKMVNYAWAGRSQGKPWWRPAAVLTCKSVVRPGHRGERLIEPSSSWFPPKFPSG